VADEAALPGIISLAPVLSNFSDTAYALSGMDLVITVDTALAHLAGALGVPTLLMVPFSPDWRWMLGREDSPWYPTMRIYRQPNPGDWETVIQQVVRDLSGS
jgi:ADP-heptose:LPS heptosyltransferase